MRRIREGSRVVARRRRVRYPLARRCIVKAAAFNEFVGACGRRTGRL
jgi:hypothetical protein